MNTAKPSTTHLLIDLASLDNVDIHELLCYQTIKELDLSNKGVTSNVRKLTAAMREDGANSSSMDGVEWGYRQFASQLNKQ